MTVPSASPNDDFADFEDAFFKSSEESNAADSAAPLEMDRPAEDANPSEDQLARRMRLRKVVGLVVGASAMVTLFVVARIPAGRPSVAVGSRPAVDVPAPSGRVASSSVARNELVREAFLPSGGLPSAAVAPVAAPNPAASVSALAVASASAVAPAPAAPAVRKEAAVPSLDSKQTKARAYLAVSSGRYAEAIGLSQAAIDADPTDAQSYLLLGAALQETGQARNAAKVFAECALKASRGPKSDCQALAPR